MSKSFDKKLEQLKLQHQIYSRLQQDNGVSSHFDYHVNLMSDQTITLNLLTYNQRHEEYMLFHAVSGTSSLDCLQKMLRYIEDRSGSKENSYTIEWTKKGDDATYKSYFMAADQDEAIAKFLHEKDEDEYRYTCTLNPVS